MTEKTETLRLAQALNNRQECEDEAADELRRLHADAEESEALRERLSELLRKTAIALRGPEPELTRWSWHDLPDLAAALKAELRRLHQFAEDQIGRATAAGAALQMTKATHALKIAAVEAQRDALLEALELAADFLEHSTEFRIGHPGFEGAQAKARAAIKAVEGEKT